MYSRSLRSRLIERGASLVKPSKAFTAPTSSREENRGMVNLWVHGAYDIRGTCDTR